MHQIRYFLAVTQTLNFTRAAEECNVAQPSLTRAIKLLEEELGSDLFRRERKLTHLTEFGQRMLPFLRQSYESAVTAKALAKSIKSAAVAPLVLALSRSVDLSIVMSSLSELSRVFPGLELKFVRCAGSEVVETLKKGEVEMAIAGALEEKWDRLKSWALFSETMTVVVDKTHKFAGRPTIEAADLVSECVLLRPYCETSARFQAFLRHNDVAITHWHEMVGDDDLVKMVEANLGIGILPASAVCPPQLQRIGIEGFGLQRDVALYAAAGRPRSLAGSAFMRLVRALDWRRSLLALQPGSAPNAIA